MNCWVRFRPFSLLCIFILLLIQSFIQWIILSLIHSFIKVYVLKSLFPFTCPLIHPFFYPSIHPSICLYTCLSVYLSIGQSVHLSICSVSNLMVHVICWIPFDEWDWTMATLSNSDWLENILVTERYLALKNLLK